MDLHQQVLHGDTCIVIRKPLESVKHLSGNDFLARLSYEPVIQKDRRTRIPESANAYFCLPKAGLKISPVFLIGDLNISPRFKKALENEILDQVGCCELC